MTANFKTNEPNIPAPPKGYRKSKGRGKMQDVCPCCCIEDVVVYGTACFYAGFSTEEAHRVPCWECGNCGHKLPRRARRTKRQMFVDRMRAEGRL